MKDTSDTLLAEALRGREHDVDQDSGFIPLASGLDALIGRMAAIDSTQKSLDLQYYIWHPDVSGKLLLHSVLAAADRGVRVRLLLDEMHGSILRPILAGMSQHPQIEVRFFNPFQSRLWRGFDAIFRFSEANRRMHNKALIADNQLAVVGGRNIGDEYFEASEELDFGDFDLISIGEVVTMVSESFDQFWNSDLSVPLVALDSKSSKNLTLDDIRADLKAHLFKVESSLYAEALKRRDLVTHLKERTVKVYWGKAIALSDSPDKAKSRNPQEEPNILIRQLRPYWQQAESQVLLVSAYFVPGEGGVEQMTQALLKGVDVRILTNSLASNDVSVVHPYYVPYRKKLLESGAEIYELKPSPRKDEKGRQKLFSSRSGLHGKVYFFDRRAMFIGSMNLDPRSLYLNSEMGLMVECPEMIEHLQSGVERALPETTYRLFLNEDGNVRWRSQSGEQVRVYDKEPQTSWWKRFKTKLLSIFIPESLL